MIKAKKATAFALILAMMASFAACSKIDNEAVSKKVESFAKAAANLDADGMCKIADGLDDDDQEMIEEVKDYIEDILRDQNDLNEEYGAQLEAITTALAELQAKPKPKRRRIGFDASNDD